MPRPGWTPSIVSNGDDQTVYLMLDDFGGGRHVEDFVAHCEGRYHDIQLPLPMRLI